MAVNRINQINQVTVIAPRFPQTFVGPGVPVGGNVNDLLRKTSAVNYETAWSSATSLGILQTADIGSTVQAYSADLAAIAGLTSAADRLPYYTGSQTAALATFTGFARNLLDDADAATARTTLGVPGLAANNTFTGDNTFTQHVAWHNTPERYGAAGDGVADDTQAIWDWLTAGGGACYDGSKIYLIDPMRLNGLTVNVWCAPGVTFKQRRSFSTSKTGAGAGDYSDLWGERTGTIELRNGTTR